MEHAEEVEACLKHLETYDGAIGNLVRGVEHSQAQIDSRKKEVESLKGRILDLETQNVLLEAKVIWHPLFLW